MAIASGIRGYMSRDWAAARRLKDQYWAERVKRLGAGEALRIADELRRQALAQVPGWPTSADRAADLEGHAHLSALLRRADRARRP